MIGKIADAFNRMFAVEKVQDQHSGNQVVRDDKVNIENFEKTMQEQSEKVSEVVDTYQSKKIRDDDSESEKRKKKESEKKEKKEDDEESDEEVIHIDKKV